MSKKYQPTSLQHLTAGQPLKISASTWNAFVQHIESSNAGDTPFEESNDNSTVIICKNSTNADIPAFTMVSLETPVLPSGYNGLGKLYNATMTLSAIPTEEDVIGVTQELIEAGASGYVLISGITPLQLGSSPSDHPYASPDGTGGFTFHDDYGTARILHAIGNNALVLIGASPSAGGTAPVADNTADLFKIYEYSATNVRVKSGVVYLGGLNVTTSESSLIGVTSTKRYIYVQVTYSNGALSAQINYSSTIQVPDNDSRYRYTLGCVYLDENNAIKIEQWHYPSPVIIYNRWIG